MVCRGPARRDLHALHVRRPERQVRARQDDPGDESQQEGSKDDRVPAEVRDDGIGPGAEHRVADAKQPPNSASATRDTPAVLSTGHRTGIRLVALIVRPRSGRPRSAESGQEMKSPGSR